MEIGGLGSSQYKVKDKPIEVDEISDERKNAEGRSPDESRKEITEGGKKAIL